MHIPDKPKEHFVTLFDSRFLPFGLTLHASLQRLAPNSHLWVICMDELVEQQISGLSLNHLSAIALHSMETDELRAVKSARTVGEYCWTITPFAAQAVFDRAADADRVTYLDSDLFFFSSPISFFKEFELSGKHVLITEHGYAPELDRTEKSGRFCVQFVTFRRTQESFEVMRWWQQRCIEWCFDRIEDGKFGDQKYLDQWPALFPTEVHILGQVDRTLAPWNSDHFLKSRPVGHMPVFFHFQSFRIVTERLARLYVGFSMGRQSMMFYEAYLLALKQQIALLKRNGIGLLRMPEPKRRFDIFRKIYMRLFRKVRYARLDI